MKGSHRSLEVECVFCGAPAGRSCVKGHVSRDFGSSKQPRKPHTIYPGQKPFVVRVRDWTRGGMLVEELGTVEPAERYAYSIHGVDVSEWQLPEEPKRFTLTQGGYLIERES